MSINVLIFGHLADITGKDSLQLRDFHDTDQLIDHLNNLFPSMKKARYACAVDQKIIRTNTQLREDSTVALLPPFSGG
ncbi:MAG: MoaD/ThiS family protein [Cyclobacteriaceae bacterium]|nr:MoaD/ThiS family protein [Cyclobacteriaceae bacterium]